MTVQRCHSPTPDVAAILSNSATIAVLGISSDERKAGYYVPEYLAEQGYRVIGVNPALAGQPMFGKSVVPTLSALTAKVDLVNVFRRSETLAAHVPDLLTLRPTVVWFQLGIHDEAVFRELTQAGIDVVSGLCTMAEHRRLGLPRRKQ